MYYRIDAKCENKIISGIIEIFSPDIPNDIENMVMIDFIEAIKEDNELTGKDHTIMSVELSLDKETWFKVERDLF